MLDINPKIGQKEAKKLKNGQKYPKKRVISFIKISPLENVSFAFSPVHLVGLSEKFVLAPKTLIGESVFMEI